MTKEWFIRYVKKAEAETPLTYEDCKRAYESRTIGADGISIALTIAWLREGLPTLETRNKRSRRKLIRYLKSEMRLYADYGSFSPMVNVIVKHFYLCKMEQLTPKEQNDASSST